MISEKSAFTWNILLLLLTQYHEENKIQQQNNWGMNPELQTNFPQLFWCEVAVTNALLPPAAPTLNLGRAPTASSRNEKHSLINRAKRALGREGDNHVCVREALAK